MKINFNRPILGLDGKPLLDDNKKEIPLSVPCINALLTNSPNENFDGVEKLARFMLAQKIQQIEGNPVELKAEEVAKIKELVGKHMNTLVAGTIWLMLETGTQ